MPADEMKTKILIAEDDEFFSLALKEITQSLGYQVTLVNDGNAAIEELKTQNFDCVVSDFFMPILGGMELLAWTRANKPTPFILMTAYGDDINTQTALQKGASNLLKKPFSRAEISAALDQVLPLLRLHINETGEPADDVDEKYCRIPEGMLLHRAPLDVHLYIKDDRGLMKVANRGEIFNPDGISADGAKSVLFTEKENLSSLIPVSIMITKIALKRTDIDEKKKLEFIRKTSELLQEKVRFGGLNEKLVRDSKEFFVCMIENIHVPQIIDLMEAVNKCGDHLHVNSLGTACMSVLIAKTLEWPLAELYKVALSGFFHDVGKLSLDRKIINKPRILLSFSERALLDRHPEFGRDFLARTNLFSDEIGTIVCQHHENECGTGYPTGLKRDQIHPIARLLHLADSFCELALRGLNGPGMPAENAIRRLVADPGIDREFLFRLRRLVASQQNAIEVKSA